MDRYDFQDRFSDELRVWAYLDGCEGGDFLNGLSSAISTAHYNYADEDETLHSLYWIALGELYWHLDSEIIYEYQDSEYVAQEFKKIKQLWTEDDLFSS